MGWGSAVDIMDAALEGAEKAVNAALSRALNEAGAPLDIEPDVSRVVDEALRPFVRTIARKLHEGDWDTIEDADHYRRFPQEMHDEDDQEFLARARERAADELNGGDLEEARYWMDHVNATAARIAAMATGERNG